MSIMLSLKEARPSSPPPALKDCVSVIITAPDATSPSLALSLLVRLFLVSECSSNNLLQYSYSDSCRILSTPGFLLSHCL